MATVVIYESHPAVLAGLRRRLEAEPELAVVGAYSDASLFAAACRMSAPDIAVVSGFGPGAPDAAKLVRRRSHAARLIALLPGLRPDEHLDYPSSFQLVSDGPRGDVLVSLLKGAAAAPSAKAARPLGS